MHIKCVDRDWCAKDTEPAYMQPHTHTHTAKARARTQTHTHVHTGGTRMPSFTPHLSSSTGTIHHGVCECFVAYFGCSGAGLGRRTKTKQHSRLQGTPVPQSIQRDNVATPCVLPPPPQCTLFLLGLRGVHTTLPREWSVKPVPHQPHHPTNDECHTTSSLALHISGCCR